MIDLLEMLYGIPSALLSDFRWYRALIGGCWERWFTPDMVEVWVPVAELTEDGGRRPHHWCRGTPTQEWYPR